MKLKSPPPLQDITILWYDLVLLWNINDIIKVKYLCQNEKKPFLWIEYKDCVLEELEGSGKEGGKWK